MPRKKIIPKVRYIQVKNPDQSKVDEVFNYLFDKFFEQEKLRKGKSTK